MSHQDLRGYVCFDLIGCTYEKQYFSLSGTSQFSASSYNLSSKSLPELCFLLNFSTYNGLEKGFQKDFAFITLDNT